MAEILSVQIVSKLFATHYHPTPISQQPPSPLDIKSLEIHTPDFYLQID